MNGHWLSLNFRKGYLRLFGRESLSSFHYQSLIARRVQAFNIEVSTCLEFEPLNFQQMAGLICYYNTGHWFYLNVSGGEFPSINRRAKDDAPQPTDSSVGTYTNPSKFLQITSCDNFQMTDILEEPIDITGIKRIYLKAHFNREKLQFYFALKEKEWQKIGNILDGSILSDDYVQHGGLQYRAAFTGAFVGLCCQDLTGHKLHADFDWFDYKEIV